MSVQLGAIKGLYAMGARRFWSIGLEVLSL